jgi:hypothetical protein
MGKAGGQDVTMRHLNFFPESAALAGPEPITDAATAALAIAPFLIKLLLSIKKPPYLISCHLKQSPYTSVTVQMQYIKALYGTQGAARIHTVFLGCQLDFLP